MSLLISFFILGSVLITSVLSGILGMAGGMVLMGVLTWLLPVQQAMMLHSTAQFFANGSRAFIHRKHIHMNSIKYFLAGLIVSFLAFCWITFIPNKNIVFLFLGIGPFIPVLLRGRVKFDFNRPYQAFLCGVIATGFQLTSGVSGPLLDMFFQKIKMTRYQVLATKAFTQSISHVTKFVYFGLVVPAAISASSVEKVPFWLYVAVIPVAVLGSHLSKYILSRITDHQFYKATQWILWAIGVIYLVKAGVSFI